MPRAIWSGSINLGWLRYRSSSWSDREQGYRGPQSRMSLAVRRTVSAVRRAPMPSWIPPMPATLTDVLPTAGKWVYEPKLDGVRALIYVSGGAVRMYSRNRKPLNDAYPELVEALGDAVRGDAVLDGEVATFDPARGGARWTSPAFRRRTASRSSRTSSGTPIQSRRRHSALRVPRRCFGKLAPRERRASSPIPLLRRIRSKRRYPVGDPQVGGRDRIFRMDDGRAATPPTLPRFAGG